jgi:hypothetical protein
MLDVSLLVLLKQHVIKVQITIYLNKGQDITALNAILVWVWGFSFIERKTNSGANALNFTTNLLMCLKINQ